MKGYRIGEPEETIAWKVLDFEYTELGNKSTKDDLAVFLGMTGNFPAVDWPALLAEFRRRHSDAEGVWICRTLRDALTYYGAFYGEGATIYQVEFDPKNVVIDLGADGTFVLYPENVTEVGVDVLAPLKKLIARVYAEHRQRYHL
jgi:hypothetical protein